MDDRTAVAIQNAAQVVEGAAHVDVGNIDVPMLVRLAVAARKPLPLRDGLPFHRESNPACWSTRPNARGADSHHIRVQHHEGQSSIAFQGMFLVGSR